jgi:hypothetical protein
MLNFNVYFATMTLSSLKIIFASGKFQRKYAE